MSKNDLESTWLSQVVKIRLEVSRKKSTWLDSTRLTPNTTLKPLQFPISIFRSLKIKFSLPSTVGLVTSLESFGLEMNVESQLSTNIMTSMIFTTLVKLRHFMTTWPMSTLKLWGFGGTTCLRPYSMLWQIMLDFSRINLAKCWTLGVEMDFVDQ